MHRRTTPSRSAPHAPARRCRARARGVRPCPDHNVGHERTEFPTAADLREPGRHGRRPCPPGVGIRPADAPAVLQFSATTLDGQAFEGTSLYGRPTIIWFWAPWCPVCKAEAPAILDALDELPDGVQAIGIPGQSDVASMQAFVDDYGLGAMTQVVDADGSLWANFSCRTSPRRSSSPPTARSRAIPGSGSKADFLAAAASIAP